MSNAAPKMLGRYHILDELGHDGLGTVHLARLEGPNAFQRWAVVRRIHAHLAADGALVGAFYDGARAAARIQDPNVATTYDVGDRSELPWVAVEYLHGESAEALIDRANETNTTVPWDIACRIVADAALGFEAVESASATSARVSAGLHSDVDPRRVIVTFAGKAKVATWLADHAAADLRRLSYSAPEDVSEAAGDRSRARVFSLGVLAWELCAGRRLFTGEDAAETHAMLDALVVPPLRPRVRCPSKLEEVVRRSLARDPAARPATARHLARELEACIVGKGLVVTDDDVGRYMLGVFADRFEAQQARLQSASAVTEVFDRGELRHLIPEAADTERSLPIADEAFVDSARLTAREAPPPISLGATFEGPPAVVRAPARAPAVAPVPAPVSKTSASTALGAIAIVVAVAGVAVLVLAIARGDGGDGVAPRGPATPRSPSTSTSTATSTATATSIPTSTSTSTATATATPTATSTPTPTATPTSTHRTPTRPISPAASASNAATGLLTVVCTPACDDVLDGAHSLGPSPVFKREVAAGAHHVTLRTTSPPVEKVVDVTVTAGEASVVRETME